MDVACRAYYQQQSDVTSCHHRGSRLRQYDNIGDYDDGTVYDDDDSDIDNFDCEDEQLVGGSSLSSRRGTINVSSVSSGGTDGDDDDYNSEESGVSPKMV